MRTSRLHISKMACSILLFLALTLTITAASTNPTLSQTQAKIREAFLAIHEAGNAGTPEPTLQKLTKQLNIAINLTRQAEELEREARAGDASNLYREAISICEQLISEAQLLREEARHTAEIQRLTAYASAPILALVSTIALHYGYRWWRRREVERIFQMEIHYEERKEQRD